MNVQSAAVVHPALLNLGLAAKTTPLTQVITQELRGQTIRTLVVGSGDVHSLDFGDGSFDFIYSYQKLEDLSRVRRALNEMRRVLRRGGSFCIGLPTNRGFTLAELRSELIAVFGEAKDVTQPYYTEMHGRLPKLQRFLNASGLSSLFSRPAWFMGKQSARYA